VTKLITGNNMCNYPTLGQTTFINGNGKNTNDAHRLSRASKNFAYTQLTQFGGLSNVQRKKTARWSVVVVVVIHVTRLITMLITGNNMCNYPTLGQTTFINGIGKNASSSFIKGIKEFCLHTIDTIWCVMKCAMQKNYSLVCCCCLIF